MCVVRAVYAVYTVCTVCTVCGPVVLRFAFVVSTRGWVVRWLVVGGVDVDVDAVFA